MANAYLSGRNTSTDWPHLRVEGVDSNTTADWAEMLAALQQSPIRIDSLNWTSSQNAILETELGQIHLGPTHSSLTPSGVRGTSPLAQQVLAQLQVLDGMRDLYNQPNCSYCHPSKIAYIDLTRPQSPTLELTPEAMQAHRSQLQSIESLR